MTTETTLEAESLLQLIAGDGQRVFRTFDDDDERRSGALSKPAIVGTLAEHSHTLHTLNLKGAAICFMVNEAVGKCRADAEVTKVRAVFVDLDGSPLAPVEACSLRPHAIVESSAGKYHAYWLVRDLPLDKFTLVQQSLIKRFGGDKVIKNLSRVMRLPGFLHAKVRKGVRSPPFVSRLRSLERFPAYSAAQILTQLTPDVVPASKIAAKSAPYRSGQTIPIGERNSTLFALARGFVNQGFALERVNDRIQAVNQSCEMPLCAKEVDEIVRSAANAPQTGFSIIPDAVFAHPEYRALPIRAIAMLPFFYHQYNGTNDGRLTMTWEDYPFLGSSKSFYEARAALANSPFLECTQTKGWDAVTKTNTPDFYALTFKHVTTDRLVETTGHPLVETTSLYRYSGSTVIKGEIGESPSENHGGKNSDSQDKAA